MNYDKYGEVINGKGTYKEIAKLLEENNTVGIGWTDEDSTHLDIIFKLGVLKFGNFQRGIKANFLYVSIIDYTSYAFVPDTIKYGTYIQEKLRLNDHCGDKVAELINGIIKELEGEQNAKN